MTTFVTTGIWIQELGTLDPVEVYELLECVYFLMKDSLTGIDRRSYCVDAVHYTISITRDHKKLGKTNLQSVKPHKTTDLSTIIYSYQLVSVRMFQISNKK